MPSINDFPLQFSGRTFLESRKLDPDAAFDMGVGQQGEFLVFHYEGIGGSRQKFRNLADKKHQYMSKAPNSSWIMPLFNQREFDDKRYIIITEGELDAVAVSLMGYSNVVSLPNGASSVEKALRDHFKYICSFSEVFICFDSDEPGQNAAMKAQSIIPESKCRNIILPNKDANDLLIYFDHLPSSRQVFKVAMEKAGRKTLETVIPMADLVEKSMEKLERGYQTGWSALDEKLGGVRLGELTVLTGDTGSGKTTFSINLMYNLASQGIPVYISSYEVSFSVIMKKIASHILRKNMCAHQFSDEEKQIFKEWASNHKVFLNPTFGSSNLEDILQEIEFAARVEGAQVILLDHLHFFLNFDSSDSERQMIDKTVRELVKAARANNVHIFLIVHPRQGKDDSGEITMASLKGSSAIKQDAHNILGVQRRDRIDPTDPKVVIKLMKNRVFGNEGTIYLYFDRQTATYEELIPKPAAIPEPHKIDPKDMWSSPS